MPYEADKTYNVTIVNAFLKESTKSGTPSVHLILESEDGQIEHDLWLTEKAREATEGRLIALGVSPDDLRSSKFWQNITEYVRGKKCSITCEDQSYNGNITTKVKWLNIVRENLASDVAKLFGGSEPEPKVVNKEPKPQPIAPTPGQAAYRAPDLPKEALEDDSLPF